MKSMDARSCRARFVVIFVWTVWALDGVCSCLLCFHLPQNSTELVPASRPSASTLAEALHEHTDVTKRPTQGSSNLLAFGTLASPSELYSVAVYGPKPASQILLTSLNPEPVLRQECGGAVPDGEMQDSDTSPLRHVKGSYCEDVGFRLILRALGHLGCAGASIYESRAGKDWNVMGVGVQPAADPLTCQAACKTSVPGMPLR